jgi:hypothetical protein
LEDTLRKYNYTLSLVDLLEPWNGVDTSEIAGYLLRNARIQRILGRLPPLFHPSLPVRVWPVVLEMASGIPPLLYKLLRRGDINALCEVVQGRNDGSDETRQGRRWTGRHY